MEFMDLWSSAGDLSSLGDLGARKKATIKYCVIVLLLTIGAVFWAREISPDILRSIWFALLLSPSVFVYFWLNRGAFVANKVNDIVSRSLLESKLKGDRDSELNSTLVSEKAKADELNLMLMNEKAQADELNSKLIREKLELDELNSRLVSENKLAIEEVNQVSRMARVGGRKAWIQSLSSTYYSSEIEVEVKFIGPLLVYLGWRLRNTSLRLNLSVSAGRQEVSAIADWLLWLDGQGGAQKPFMIIEAKAPREELDISVINQARSYAFASGSPYYMVTNSRRIIIYELVIGRDRELLDLDVRALGSRWDELQSTFDKALEIVSPQIA